MKRIGFIQGTFDLFHIGHLNLIKKAKEYCDYLIVAVNTDELVLNYKGHYPIISLEERKQIVENIKYVDQVVEAPHRDKIKFYKQYHFNYLIMGDDWKGSSFYNQIEEELKKYEQVSIIYLPYTKSTSSTKIKESIIKEYLNSEKKS